MSADLLALLDSDPAAGILAAADLIERSDLPDSRPDGAFLGDDPRLVMWMRLAVRRWRGVVERHHQVQVEKYDGSRPGCTGCHARSDGELAPWPCPDFRETADEARAYLGGAS